MQKWQAAFPDSTTVRISLAYYYVNYAWGIGLHGQKQGGVILPEMMRWLWRDQAVSTDPNDTAERAFRAAAAKAAEPGAQSSATSSDESAKASPRVGP